MSDLEPLDITHPARMLRELCVQGGADAASLTFGKANLIVTATSAKFIHPETGVIDVDVDAALPCDQSAPEDER